VKLERALIALGVRPGEVPNPAEWRVIQRLCDEKKAPVERSETARPARRKSAGTPL
jgi:hypothetical protein